MFANLEQGASPIPCLHLAFLTAIGQISKEDPFDRLRDVEIQLGWLREHGFEDVDCHWKWLEMELLVDVTPTEPR